MVLLWFFWEFILIIVKNKIENCVCIYDNVIFCLYRVVYV